MIVLSYFTWIHLFFKFIHICKPEQVSGIISQRVLNEIWIWCSNILNSTFYVWFSKNWL